jgi:hypothetical protein
MNCVATSLQRALLGTQKELIANIKDIGALKNSIFLHDSDHSYISQQTDYSVAENSGFDLILSDDIDAVWHSVILHEIEELFITTHPNLLVQLGLNKMKVLVTGAAGFIGGNLIKTLVDKNVECIGIDNFSDYYSIEMKKIASKEYWYRKY